MAKIKEIDDLEVDKKEKAFVAGADMKKATKNKGGRPKKSEDKKASEQIFINVTKTEKEKIDAKAQELGISVSALAKIALKQFM